MRIIVPYTTAMRQLVGQTAGGQLDAIGEINIEAADTATGNKARRIRVTGQKLARRGREVLRGTEGTEGAWSGGWGKLRETGWLPEWPKGLRRPHA